MTMMKYMIRGGKPLTDEVVIGGAKNAALGIIVAAIMANTALATAGDLPLMASAFRQAIAAHKAAGMEYIVTPGWGVPKNLKDAQTMCDYANEIGKMCREAGLKYGCHTHSHEYQKVEDQVWMEYFVENTDPENMFWQMDTYWACWGNQFPVHYFKKYPGRFKMLHIKDKYELGESGFVGFDAIFGVADIAGLENFIVEIEETDGQTDIMEACRRSAEYIQNLPAVKATYAK